MSPFQGARLRDTSPDQNVPNARNADILKARYGRLDTITPILI